MSELTKELRAQANSESDTVCIAVSGEGYYMQQQNRISELEQQLKQQWVSVDDEIKKALMQVGGEISQDTRIQKKSRDFAIAIILNKISDLGGIDLSKPPTK